MTPRVERQLAGLFFNFGKDSCRNVRARVTHYQPWAKDSLGNEDTMGNDAMLQTGVEHGMKGVQGSLAASTALVTKYGNSGRSALQALGVPSRAIGAFAKTARGLRAATRGLGAMGDVYDQLATLGAFSYSDSLLISRAKRRLELRSTREGYEEYAQYVGKCEPFFKTIQEFITLTSMSIEAMPSEDVDIYAIEAAFVTHDIPIPDDLHDLFYDPSPAIDLPADGAINADDAFAQ